MPRSGARAGDRGRPVVRGAAGKSRWRSSLPALLGVAAVLGVAAPTATGAVVAPAPAASMAEPAAAAPAEAGARAQEKEKAKEEKEKAKEEKEKAKEEKPARPFDARQVYQRDCASCHGAEAEGTPRGPQLRGVGEAFVHYELATGRMPLKSPEEVPRRKKPPYSPAEVRKLVAYLSSLGAGTGEPISKLDLKSADLGEGGELYRAQCAACHAWAGDGGGLLFREAPDLHQSKAVEVAEAVRVGPGTMPKFSKTALSDRELDSVVAYVLQLDRPEDRGGHGLWHIGPLAEGLVALTIGIGAVLLLMQWIGESGEGESGE